MATPEHQELRNLSNKALADRYRAAWWANDVEEMEACRAEQAWRHGKLTAPASGPACRGRGSSSEHRRPVA